jgi:hypothetical protein
MERKPKDGFFLFGLSKAPRSFLSFHFLSEKKTVNEFTNIFGFKAGQLL